MTFSEFILEHDGADLAALALSRSRFAAQVPDFDLALTTLEVRRKLRDKVPEWYAVPSLRFPLRISGEQCSSTATARYKALVAARCAAGSRTDSASAVLEPSSEGASRTDSAPAVLEPSSEGASRTDSASAVLEPPSEGASRTNSASAVLEGRIADLTGGLGVDSWAFSKVFGQVLYNEMKPELADAAAHNFRELGVTNITVRNHALVPSALIPGSDPESSEASISLIPGSDPGSPASVFQILGDFRPDVIFLDPARRAADGRKVFRLEDCQPDVMQLLPELLSACPRILLKLSPMDDITLVCKQLGCVKAVHVVAADGECKELLLVLEKDWTGPHTLTVVEDGAVADATNSGASTAKIYPNRGICAVNGPVYHTLPVMADSDRPSLLFEPGKALLKAGAFDLPCQFGLAKLGLHTHLYVGEEVPEELRPFGKCFRVLESAPLDKRSIKTIGQKYPRADVTARNIPLTSDQLRKKLGVGDGGSVHIFGVHIDSLEGNYLLVTSR